MTAIMAQKKRDFTKHVSFILPDASGDASHNANRGDTVDQLNTYLEAQRARQRRMQNLALELPIDQSYTGPLHRVRVLLKQSGQDNNHLTVCNSASDPINTELDAITRQTILGQHVRVGLLAATQDHLEIKCSFASGEVACEIYFDPASDDVLLLNTGQSVVQVNQTVGTAGAECLPPEELKLLSPGLWFVSVVGAHAQTVEMLVRPRHYSLSVQEVGQPIAKRAGGKMLPPPPKRMQSSSGAMVTSTTAQTRGDSTSSAERSAPPQLRATITKSLHPHELAQTESGQRIVMKNTDTQETEYTLERLGNWVYGKTQTHMFTAVLRKGESSPTVAVLMPKLWESAWRDLPKRELYAAVHTANRWWRQYDMMVNLKHPNLVSCFGADLRCLSLYLQWPGSINLASASKDDHYTGGPDDVRVILADCSQALDYLASHGIVHNSVTPWSIAYRPGDRAGAVLTDFDCAMRRSGVDDTRLAPVCYAAPETLQHSGSVYSDVWSLGVVMLYVMRLSALPGTPKHVRTLGQCRLDRLKAWHENVVAIRATLDTSDNDVAGIVALMLMPEETTLTGSNAGNGRISPSALGRETRRWASTKIFSPPTPHSAEE
ncbi:hypothetical protein KVR01_012333 [Diaporthe batatas]|uniref:uncharacterized protein n=1 Tax=Diaporthe batatas TaxID=748121 RepID=UPI001D0448E9|nr:uncharacterized protein KVR01_012333 [Diaporthe batatas]KAG8157671.1 hypothetical protein KVR01_012333 [Diaporthe batatas]